MLLLSLVITIALLPVILAQLTTPSSQGLGCKSSGIPWILYVPSLHLKLTTPAVLMFVGDHQVKQLKCIGNKKQIQSAL